MPSKPMVIRYIARQIIATKKHCSNDCPGMGIRADWCIYFDEKLIWDKKRRENGCLRLDVCKKRELNLRDE